MATRISRENERRALRALKALEAGEYFIMLGDQPDVDEYSASDLISDLLHLGAERNWNLDDILTRAEHHFHYERREAEKHESEIS